MSIEELLYPRFEVLADYPNSPFRVGNIIKSQFYGLYCEPPINKFPDYPHLFKKLQWFEKRKEEEMPKYLKHTLSDKTTTYHKVKSYDLSNPKFIEWKWDDDDFGNFGMWSKDFNYIPCSEEEYLSNCNKA